MSKVKSCMSIMAPPFPKRVAASGTQNTLSPNDVSTFCKCDRAVVLPAQGPPVKHSL